VTVVTFACVADGGDMTKLEVADQRLNVPKALKEAYNAVDIPYATGVAQVSGDDREPALVLFVGDDLVLVSPRGEQRWPIGEIERVDGVQIFTRAGVAVGISGWWYPGQAQRFRTALRDRIGQPIPLEGTDSLPPPPSAPPPRSRDGLAKVVGFMSAVVVGAAIVAVLGLEGLGDKAGTVLIPAAVAALLSLPLLICGIKLAASGTPRQAGLGIAGALLGIAGGLVLAYGIVIAVALSNCSGECF
jgi:hypothetical protein